MLTLPIDLELICDRGHVVPCDGTYLSYDPRDPFAVTMTVVDPTHGDELEWMFARDLLSGGLLRLAEPISACDVRIWRCSPYQVHITLDSPEGRAELHAEAQQIEAFLSLTYQMVPPTHEMDGVDIDRELALIFGEAA